MMKRKVEIFLIVSVMLIVTCLLITFAKREEMRFRSSSYRPMMLQQECEHLKTLVIDVENSGLGNRMFAIISASVLAFSMNRILKLKWNKLQTFKAKYNDLFDDSLWTSSLSPFETQSQEPKYELSPSKNTKTVCNLELDQHNFDHFTILGSKSLWNRLNFECDEIEVQSNHYFANLLQMPWFGGNHAENKLMFPTPFRDVQSKLLRPTSNIRERAKKFEEDHIKGAKWLTIHSRGFYDEHGVDTSYAVNCANQLLNSGHISKVFLATESRRILELVKEKLTDPSSLVYIEKNLIDDRTGHVDSYDLRDNTDELETALTEFLLVGNGTYCISPTILRSTFSKASIVSGSCKFIPTR